MARWRTFGRTLMVRVGPKRLGEAFPGGIGAGLSPGLGREPVLAEADVLITGTTRATTSYCAFGGAVVAMRTVLERVDAIAHADFVEPGAHKLQRTHARQVVAQLVLVEELIDSHRHKR